MGGGATITIPGGLDASCRSAYEFYARTYGCNNIDDFQTAQAGYNRCQSQARSTKENIKLNDDIESFVIIKTISAQ
jgi:hypothetical protein